MGYENTWADFPAVRGRANPDFLYEDSSGMRIFSRLQRDNPHLCPSLGEAASRHNPDYSPDLLMSLGACMFLGSSSELRGLDQEDSKYRRVLSSLASRGLTLPDFNGLNGENLRLLYSATRDYLTHRLRVKDHYARADSSLQGA